MRIAVCIHVYYVYMWAEIKYYLDIIGRVTPFDLYITLPEENEYLENIIGADFEQVTYIYAKSVGWDIYPFLRFIDVVDISKYDIIFKFHTKKDIPIRYQIRETNLSGSRWRNILYGSLAGDEQRVRMILHLFQSEPTIGMICASECVVRNEEVKREIDFNCVLHVLGVLGVHLNQTEFCAGTMFAVRPVCLLPLKERRFTAEEFPPYFPRDWNGLDYCLERVFAMLPSSLGYTLHPLKSIKYSNTFPSYTKVKLSAKERIKALIPYAILIFLYRIKQRILNHSSARSLF